MVGWIVNQRVDIASLSARFVPPESVKFVVAAELFVIATETELLV